MAEKLCDLKTSGGGVVEIKQLLPLLTGDTDSRLTAYGTLSSAMAAWKALDGINSTAWFSSVNGSWIQYDFGKPVTVASCYVDRGWGGQADVKLYYSDDGITFHDIVGEQAFASNGAESITNGVITWVLKEFTPHQFWRLYYYSGTNNGCRIWELYGY